MNAAHLYVVILAGGEGTRFAPLSTPDLPKQFLVIADERRSLIQQTWDRLSLLTRQANIFVSTNQRFVPLVREHLPLLNPDNIVAEPVKKNTAAPIALVSRLIERRDPDAVVLFCPSDHYLEDDKRTGALFLNAAHFAASSLQLVTFGITPEFPSPDYGYIHVGAEQKNGKGARQVMRFVEKPDVETAKGYLESGDYLWNSGNFCWHVKTFMSNLAACEPRIWQALERYFPLENNVSGDFEMKSYFEEVPSLSIDYGLMEKAKSVAVFPFTIGWSDVGTWQGLDYLIKRFGVSPPQPVVEVLRQKLRT